MTTSSEQPISGADKLRLLRLAREAGIARSAAPPAAPIEALARTGALACSHAQQRLWFLSQFEGANAAYHITEGWLLDGPLARDALRRALDAIVARHASLRTVFEERDGMPVQRILAPQAGCALAEAAGDDASLAALHSAEAEAPFDLARGPLIRARLVRLASHRHALFVTMHHIVSDGWSMGVFGAELGALYSAFAAGRDAALAPLRIQYADYAAWQQRPLDDAARGADAAYWKAALAGAPELIDLPLDHPRPPRQRFSGAVVALALDAELTHALKALSRRHGATLFMTLLTAWALLLHRLSGQDDVVIGTPVANRGHADVEPLIGFFVNTLALRIEFAGQPELGQLLARVRDCALAAQRHQELPFERVVELAQPRRSTAYGPLFQVAFAWDSTLRAAPVLAGLAVAALPAPAQLSAKFDLTLALADHGDGIAGTIEFADALFERATVERFGAQLKVLLAAMCTADASAQAASELALLPAAQRAQLLVQFNPPAPGHACDGAIHTQFEQQAARTPDAIAIEFGRQRVRYADLDGAANRLAHYLIGHGVGAGQRVAICIERSLAAVVAMLATLKAGGAYLPLDPAHPPERLAALLADAAPVMLLTADHAAVHARAAGAVPVLALDGAGCAPELLHLPRSQPALGEHAPTGQSLAYVIYTSGSTGVPKGVMVEHRQVLNLALGAPFVPLGPDDRVAHCANPAFDAATWEIWGALLVGARVVVVPQAVLLDADALCAALAGARVSAMFITSGLFNAFAERLGPAFAGMRYVLTGGEAFDRAPVRRLHANGHLPAHLMNVYGPTETTTFATICEIDDAGGPGHTAPIGRPVGNRVYILDVHGAPVPLGVVGEIHIGGGGVARGYLFRPELSAERFIADPFADTPGARMYRTGDLGRWRADGAIDFVGRNDFQVKLRGFRIELGEIEARLASHALVGEAVVVARRDGQAGMALVAYYTGTAAAGAAALLRAHLARELPDYMLPAAYVHLAALPLTPNGKVDRQALPAPDAAAHAARVYAAPAGAFETALASLWCELLTLDRVGRDDHFFELGGHSLLAVTLVARLRQRLGVEVGLAEVFDAPVLRALALRLAQAGAASMPALTRRAPGGDVVLSFAQQRLWFMARLDGGSAAYHIPVGLLLDGPLDQAALARALDTIVARHEALRTVFVDADGSPMQRVLPAHTGCALALTEFADAAGGALDAALAAEAALPFDLARGPLLRARLWRLAPARHALLITLHHIAADGWSMGVLTDELNALYSAYAGGAADPLPALALQYADYALWQRGACEGARGAADAAYWKAALAGAPPLIDLPLDRVRPARQRFSGAAVALTIDAGLVRSLKALSQRHGVTLFTTLLAAWALLLQRLSGQQEVVIGTPVANRGHAGIEALIGFFVNTLALRIDLSGEPDVAQLLARVRQCAVGAQQHQGMPFEQVVELVQPARSMAYSPLVQVAFAWDSTARSAPCLRGLAATALATPDQASAKFELTLSLAESGERICGAIEYADALFEHASVERFAAQLLTLLASMADAAAVPASRLELLPPAQRDQLLTGFNGGAATPAAAPALCIHTVFEQRAARTPDAIALACGDVELSYADLDARANRLAHYLVGRGVGPDQRVAIAIERGIAAVVAMLATLKAGGAYLPLDPGHPAERLAALVADAAPTVLLTAGPVAFAAGSVPQLALDALADAPALRAFPGTPPAPAGRAPAGADLAYVIYTSGSTGQPKGVMVEHRNVLGLVIAHASVQVEAADRVAHCANLAFDAAVWEVWATLLNGARLVVVPPPVLLDVDALGALMLRAGVTVMVLTTSLFTAYAARLAPAIARLRLLLCGGEALDPAPVRRLIASGQAPRLLFNGYGPTETTVFSTAYQIEHVAADAHAVSIGRPAGSRVYVLDIHGALLPLGAVGEICIGGGGVARGYLFQPQLSAERFVADPFAGTPGARMYRTGDLGRWRADGSIDFMGRNDFQVKLRGFRIEPGEIEARLASHALVGEAVVLARRDAHGGATLVAYYTPGEDLPAGDAATQLRAHLARTLPAHMLPSAFVALAALPLTPNGKLDRQALPAPDAAAHAVRAYAAPEGPWEEALAALWCALLGLAQVGRDDHFFELGGHSLLAVTLVARLRQRHGVDIGLADVFDAPVLRVLAARLAQAGAAALPPLTRRAAGGDVALSFAQQRLWFLAQFDGASDAYHIPAGWLLEGPLDEAALARALDTIVARHEALRTVFVDVDGAPAQRILRADIGCALAIDGAEACAAIDAEGLAGAMAAEAARPFDLARAPALRARLLRLGPARHALLVTVHHIASDGWSMGVLARELDALYGAYAAGAADTLAPLPVQYADYALWQRGLHGGAHEEADVAFWTAALAGAPQVIDLPLDRPRPPQRDYRGGLVPLHIDAGLAQALKALSQRHGVTLFMTLLAAWAVLLHRLGGQDEVVIGTPVANRGHADIEQLIGFFVNTLALRIDLGGAPDVAQLLARVRQCTVGAQQHQNLPFERVVEIAQPLRSLSHSPVFQVAFAWDSTAREAPRLGQLQLSPLPAAPHASAKFDLTLALAENGDGIDGGIEFAGQLFDQATVQRFAEQLPVLLTAMCAAGAIPVARLPLMPPAQRAQLLVAFNPDDGTPAQLPCIHSRFEQQAARTPDAVAIEHDGERLSYAELDGRANRLAHYLAAQGVGADRLVAICIERSIASVVAMLATLKAGGAYLPLDPAHPAERLAATLADAEPVLLLQGAQQVQADGVPVLTLDAAAGAPELARFPVTPPAARGRAPAAADLAVVIYTSGSTGVPKGVMIEHRNVLNLVAGNPVAPIVAEDRMAHLSNPAFDAATWEIWGALLNGARLVVVARATLLDADALGALMLHTGVTTMLLTTSLFTAYAARLAPALAQLRLLLCGGEALDMAPVRRLLAGGQMPACLLNSYGPTEATTYASTYGVGVADAAARAVPIGRPIGNARIYILDAFGEPVPMGVHGEIHIGGAGVARGYLRRPALSAERFVADPFAAGAGATMYRTGDLGCWRADGNIDFIGRNDFQVKLRGFRIEPGEIEARLASHPLVGEAVVLARPDALGETALVAYYTAPAAAGAGADTVAQLRGHLARTLPAYMLPAAYVAMAAMPLTPNGKLDRQALPAPAAQAAAPRSTAAPEGALEQALAALWCALLGLDKVGRDDHFFELGGHSLRAVELVNRARRQGIAIAMQDVFQHPVLGALAAHLQAGAPPPPRDAAILVKPGGARAPLFMAHDGHGELLYAFALAPHLATDAPVYGLPAIPADQPQLGSIAAMAARMVRMVRAVQAQGPYRLLGWSFGGALAHEVAAQLAQAGEALAFVGMLDTYHPSAFAARGAARDERTLLLDHIRAEASASGPQAAALAQRLAGLDALAGVDGLASEAQALGLMPPTLSGLSALQLRLNLARKHAFLHAYRSHRPGSVPLAVHLFAARTAPQARAHRGWPQAGQALRVQAVDGTHDSMLQAGHVAELGALVSVALADGA